jgi:polyisoprenoid-binding protein YceI
MGSTISTVTHPDYRVGTWKADPVHSEIAFSVRHLMLSNVRGRFTRYDVTINTGEDLSESSITTTIELASIDTGNQPRDEHLRSADYLDVQHHSVMSYRSTGIRRDGDGWLVDGELTLHGITRPVSLTSQVNGFAADPFGGRRAGFSATAKISRREFGIGAALPLDGGGVAVGDTVAISLEIEAVLQQ